MALPSANWEHARVEKWRSRRTVWDGWHVIAVASLTVNLLFGLLLYFGG